MISKENLNLFVKCHRFGFWAQILPWYWDPYKESFVLIRKKIKNGKWKTIDWLKVQLSLKLFFDSL